MDLSQLPAVGPALFCGACGGGVVAGSRFCTRCGTAVEGAAGAAPAMSPPAVAPPAVAPPAVAPPAVAPPVAPVADGSLDLLSALRFPFAQPDWQHRLWWLPLVFFLPAFNVVLMRGWRLDVARRIGRRSALLLPELSDIGRFFADGMILWAMTALYFLPQLVLLTVFGSGLLDTALTIGGWLLELLAGNQSVSIFTLLSQIGVGALVRFILPTIYWVLTYPLYRIAMVRYAVSGRLGVFFDLLTNLRLAGRHYVAVMTLFLFEYLTTTLFVAVGGVVASTLIGALLVPIVLFPALYWTTGYLFGSFALRIAEAQQ